MLTGGPGCDKTHTLRTLVEVAEHAGAVIALAAPTEGKGGEASGGDLWAGGDDGAPG
ncbi:hypothetical protein [Streptomyces longispororuber]|uniref:hypothetical protein n=1 Tax=Streptomyces longispororuber TaxID=68230 RepID=UPI0035AB9FA1